MIRMGPYPRIPSGPAVLYDRIKGRTQDCTRPKRKNIESTLAMREPSTQDVQRGVTQCLELANPRHCVNGPAAGDGVCCCGTGGTRSGIGWAAVDSLIGCATSLCSRISRALFSGTSFQAFSN